MFTDNMFQAQYVVSIIGVFESWPNSILRTIFVDEPTRTKVRTVAAFFYGNGLPVHIAVQFYVLCNGRRPVTITHTYAGYYNWLLAQRTPHLATYYVRQGRRHWINGWRLDSVEPVSTDVPLVIPLATQGTGLHYLITYKIGGIVMEPIPTLH
jgi:hypothetical protein